MKRWWLVVCAIALLGLLGGCAGYPKLLKNPFNSGGTTLNSPQAEMTPRMSRQYLVFASDRLNRQDIYLYDRETREFIDLPGLNAMDAIASDPAISEDGNYIAFASTRGGRSDIYLYNRQTRQLRNLTTTLDAQVRHPTIDADGTIIAFESSLNGQWDIVVYNRYGQALNVPLAPQ